jgi:hypothetical protein
MAYARERQNAANGKGPSKMNKLGILGAVAALLISLLGGASGAAAQQTQAAFTGQGHAICGGVDLRTGKLLDSCGFVSAKYTGKAVGKCPSGSFFDIGTWACFTCPSGYNRTAFAVDTPQACSKQVRAEYKYARRVSGHKSCPNGTFKDPRNGGECWQCPSGFGRTLSAVNAWDACGKFGASARRAEFIDRVCPEGTITDLNGSCYSCPEGYRRTAAAVTGHNACFRNEDLKPAEQTAALTCKAGEHFDFIDGGTCWECPENSVRSVSGVKTDKACEFTNIRWEAAKRTPNGLFKLPGGHEIAAEVIKERTQIDKILDEAIKAEKVSGAEATEFRDVAWEHIRTGPESSSVLMAAVYQRVFDLIKNGPRTKPERDLLNYMAVYIQQSRQLAASEMDSIWKSWTRGQEARTSALATRSMHSAYDVGVAPPDLKSLVANVMHLAPAAAMTTAFLGAYALENVSPAFAQLTARAAVAIRPFTWVQKIASLQQTAEKAGAAITHAAAAAQAGAGVIGSFAAPFAIMTAASVIFSIATENTLAQNQQISIVNDALETSKKPVNLSRLILTPEGRVEVLSNWALMTQEYYKPNARTWAALVPTQSSTGNTATVNVNGTNIVIDVPVVPSVTLEGDRTVVAGASGSAPSWEKVAGAALDVAIGSDGTVYAIGVNKTNGGYQMFKRAKTDSKWTKIIGGALRVAVSGTEAWVVNDKGGIFVRSGTRWRKVSGPTAQDIGASPKGVWIIGADEKIYVLAGKVWQNVPGEARRIDIDQDGRPWVVNARGYIFVHDNNRVWQKLPGAAVDIAVDVPGVARIVGKDGKIYAFNETKRNWDPVSQDKDSLGIGAGGGQVWRLTSKNEIYRLR